LRVSVLRRAFARAEGSDGIHETSQEVLETDAEPKQPRFGFAKELS